MSTRFEIVRTDAGHHTRLIGGNGQPVWTTEVYTRRRAALRAVVIAAEAFAPLARFEIASGADGLELHVAHGDDGWTTVEVVEIRDVDERSTR